MINKQGTHCVTVRLILSPVTVYVGNTTSGVWHRVAY